MLLFYFGIHHVVAFLPCAFTGQGNGMTMPAANAGLLVDITRLIAKSG